MNVDFAISTTDCKFHFMMVSIKYIYQKENLLNYCKSVLLLKVDGYTFIGSNSSLFIFASLFNEVYSKRKEFAPLGANSFL